MGSRRLEFIAKFYILVIWGLHTEILLQSLFYGFGLPIEKYLKDLLTWMSRRLGVCRNELDLSFTGLFIILDGRRYFDY
jgi:hypothetical protein